MPKEVLITSEDLQKWLNRDLTKDDIELCDYLANAVKNQYEFGERISKVKTLLKTFGR